MPLQEVVILNPRRKATKRKSAAKSRSKASTKKRSSARRKSGGKSMATRRRKTAARKTGGRRKTTTRRRRTTRRKSSPKRRRTTRRKTRRKSSGRRKTTSRRRRATRRKPTTRRRRTRRKSTSRRKPRRTKRKTTRRKRRTSRRKPTTRRRRTRRKSAPRRRRATRRRTARRKSGRRKTARRKTARRKSGVRALMGRRRSRGKMSLKGFKSFVKDHLVGRALGVTAFGLMLPTLGIYAATRFNIGSMVSRVPVLGTVMGNAYGRAALGATVTAGLSYLAYGAGLLGRNEAIMANSIALVLFGLNAMRNAGHLPGMLQAAVPASSGTEGLASSMFGYGGSYMNGYGGYLGYLGDAHDEEDAAGELFGYNAAPQVNVF